MMPRNNGIDDMISDDWMKKVRFTYCSESYQVSDLGYLGAAVKTVRSKVGDRSQVIDSHLVVPYTGMCSP
jgi:hypothetical protein